MLQTSRLFRVDLTKIRGQGDFDCPKCGTRISPDDRTEKTYKILGTFMKENKLDSVTLQCVRCESEIHIVGFNTLRIDK